MFPASHRPAQPRYDGFSPRYSAFAETALDRKIIPANTLNASGGGRACPNRGAFSIRGAMYWLASLVSQVPTH
jgi:hypothetical protein